MERSGTAPDHRLSGYPLARPTNDPPPDNEAHAIRIRTVESGAGHVDHVGNRGRRRTRLEVRRP